jgi:ketosteroid isomerase-like protein
MRPILYLSGATFLSIILTSWIASSAGNSAGEIIALTRAALNRWGKGDIRGPLELYAPDITYFDPLQEKRVDGIEAMREIYAPLAGKLKIGHYEMIDPKVQRYGDVAILTFNFVDDVIQAPGSPGNIKVRWNCTQVYVRMNGNWRVVSEHWSFVKPEPKITPIR